MRTAGNGRKVTLLVAGVGLLLLAIAVRDTWSDIAFFFDFERLGINAQSCAEYRHRKTGIVFVTIPGNPSSGNDSTSRPFLIAKHPLALEDWRRFTGAPPPRQDPDSQVFQLISPEAAQAFSDRTGLLAPTKTQWDQACRPGEIGTVDISTPDTLTPYRNTISDSKLDTVSWVISTRNTSEETPPNLFGLQGRVKIMAVNASSGQPRGYVTMGGFRPTAPLP
jgi:hypothetical protein